MKKNIVRLNEAQLRKMIKESVKRILREEEETNEDIQEIEEVLSSVLTPAFNKVEHYYNIISDGEYPNYFRKIAYNTIEKLNEKIVETLNELVGEKAFDIEAEEGYYPTINTKEGPEFPLFFKIVAANGFEDFLEDIEEAAYRKITYAEVLAKREREEEERRRQMKDADDTMRQNKRKYLKGTEGMSDDEIDKIGLKPVGKIDLPDDPGAKRRRGW